MMDNAGDPKQVRRAEKLARIAEREDRETVVQIMSTQQGRAWMLRKLEAGHIFSDPFTGDALREAFIKGERNFALQLLNDIMRCATDEYILMMRERNERDTSNQNPDDRSSVNEQPRSPDRGRDVEGAVSDDDDGVEEGTSEFD